MIALSGPKLKPRETEKHKELEMSFNDSTEWA